MKTIRDPVHGDIALTPLETGLLDTPPVQRLRGIKQLGSAFLVYPGAMHTRFEHSLGTAWMAKRLARALSAGEGLTPEEEELAAVAGLLHDVTHIPFGHTLEDERRVLPRHDQSARRLLHFVDQGELGRRLDKSGLKRHVLALLWPDQDHDSGKHGGAPSLPHVRPCVRELVSSTICADLLDYLARDSYFCGLQMRYDERIFRYFHIHDDHLVLDLHKHGQFRRDALSEVSNLLRIRYVLSERVYYHHAKIAGGVMISKAVETAIASGLRQRELFDLRDDGLILFLRQRFARSRAVRSLLDLYVGRRLFKRCFLLQSDIGDDRQSELVSRFHFDRNGERRKAERAIARQLGRGTPHWAIAIYCPPMGMRLKEAEVPILTSGGRVTALSELDNDEIQLLKERHRDLWKFYVFASPEHVPSMAAAGKAAEEVLGFRNRLSLERHGR